MLLVTEAVTLDDGKTLCDVLGDETTDGITDGVGVTERPIVGEPVLDGKTLLVVLGVPNGEKETDVLLEATAVGEGVAEVKTLHDTLGDADMLGDVKSISSAHCVPEHIWPFTDATTPKTLALGFPAAVNVVLRSVVSDAGDNIVTEANWVAKVCVCAGDAETGATIDTTYPTCCNARPPWRRESAARSRLKPQFADAVTHADGT